MYTIYHPNIRLSTVLRTFVHKTLYFINESLFFCVWMIIIHERQINGAKSTIDITHLDLKVMI